MIYDVVVIGAGAGGCFAAIRTSELYPGARICILESARKPLAKVEISGGGRCNVTPMPALNHKSSLNFIPGAVKNYWALFIISSPAVVERVLRRHVYPAIGKFTINDVRPHHIDGVLTKIVEAGAPTVANDAMRYMFRMFHFAVKRKWTEVNPVAGFDISDAGGTETSRERWLSHEDLTTLAHDMRTTVNFGRMNELAVWLLLALCVRKMELLSAKCADFDLDRGLWKLERNRTKTNSYIEIPLAPQVTLWLEEAIVFACGSEYLFPARRLIRMKNGQPRTNRFEHVSPDTLNVALKRLPLEGIAHFTVHDMRRTARTHLGALGVDPFVAERALNHKVAASSGRRSA